MHLHLRNTTRSSCLGNDRIPSRTRTRVRGRAPTCRTTQGHPLLLLLLMLLHLLHLLHLLLMLELLLLSRLYSGNLPTGAARPTLTINLGKLGLPERHLLLQGPIDAGRDSTAPPSTSTPSSRSLHLRLPRRHKSTQALQLLRTHLLNKIFSRTTSLCQRFNRPRTTTAAPNPKVPAGPPGSNHRCCRRRSSSSSLAPTPTSSPPPSTPPTASTRRTQLLLLLLLLLHLGPGQRLCLGLHLGRLMRLRLLGLVDLSLLCLGRSLLRLLHMLLHMLLLFLFSLR